MFSDLNCCQQGEPSVRRRITQYFDTPWGVLLALSSVVVITVAMAVMLLIEGWQLGAETGGSSTSRSASLAALAAVALVFASPLVIAFNLICFLVWWTVAAIKER